MGTEQRYQVNPFDTHTLSLSTPSPFSLASQISLGILIPSSLPPNPQINVQEKKKKPLNPSFITPPPN